MTEDRENVQCLICHKWYAEDELDGSGWCDHCNELNNEGVNDQIEVENEKL